MIQDGLRTRPQADGGQSQEHNMISMFGCTKDDHDKHMI